MPLESEDRPAPVRAQFRGQQRGSFGSDVGVLEAGGSLQTHRLRRGEKAHHLQAGIEHPSILHGEGNEDAVAIPEDTP